MSTEFDITGEKQFDRLDFLTQLDEPFVHPLNTILGKLPHEYVLTFEDLVELRKTHRSKELSVWAVLLLMARRLKLHWSYESYFTHHLIGDRVYLEVKDGIVDFDTKEYTAEIKFLKVENQIEEKFLLNVVADEIVQPIRFIKKSDLYGFDVARAKELLDLMGVTTKAYARRTIQDLLISTLRDVVLTDKWRVRNGIILKKVGKWVHGYIFNGTTADLSNFCMLKAMTHGGHPIYEFKETT